MSIFSSHRADYIQNQVRLLLSSSVPPAQKSHTDDSFAATNNQATVAGTPTSQTGRDPQGSRRGEVITLLASSSTVPVYKEAG